MGIVSKWRNRPLPERYGRYVWLGLLALPAATMALLLGSFRGVTGFLAGGYAGLTLTILTIVVVRILSARNSDES